MIALAGCASGGAAAQVGAADAVEEGLASYYAPRFHGQRTASGERYDQQAYTAAHRTHPFGTLVRVTNQVNDRSVDVRVNDRGPFVRGRIIDLSAAAARDLRMIQDGIVRVRVEVLRWGEGS
ncbi:MAG: septal ring lytic transglycosylase RlpA family protein [Spiribacter salinus]|uniref:Endolytic peptidoglycan transglycosylase RlpA n=1 Tax=Spiribacter salinus TaxID=1335746 RepID=A0A540V736_9GAMM|nr:MAG: septal ring lytic transglycosylase RlpA family protein [Spiribacter salinus]